MQKEKIHFLAEHDSLTNLPNRRSFMQRVELSMSKGREGAIILIDMDNFKSINDTLGHILGDEVLIIVADRLNELVQDHIFIARFGGDEFLILFENTKDAVDLQTFVDLIFHIFNEPIEINGNNIKIDFSMGISKFPQDSSIFNQIMMNADLALYTVKNSGKNHYAFFNAAMENHLKQKNEVKTMIQIALKNNGFKMVYQPKVSLSAKKIVGYEALVRLKDYTLSPMTFIQIAEEYGLIIPLGRTVTQKVIEQMAKWRSNGVTLKPVSINFCALQLYDATYIDFLFECLTANKISPEMIQIEITEHIFIDNKELAIRFMNQLREHGVGIALDDFGAEYSSLSFLSALPVDTLKFDREMNLRLLSLEDQSAMENLIAFINSLKLQIVAEGIEKFEHVIQLRDSGCDVVQGFYFSKPVEADEVPIIDATVYNLDQ